MFVTGSPAAQVINPIDVSNCVDCKPCDNGANSQDCDGMRLLLKYLSDCLDSLNNVRNDVNCEAVDKASETIFTLMRNTLNAIKYCQQKETANGYSKIIRADEVRC